MTWNLDELRSNVERKYGTAQKNKLCACLSSLHERPFHAIYHFQEAEKTIDSVIDRDNPTRDHIRLILGSASNNEDSQMTIFKINVHLIACILAMHSISDILSHAIHYSLNLKEESKVSIYKIIRNNNTPTIIREKLQILTEHIDYNYLCSLANHSKHHSLTLAMPSVNITANKSGMKFSAFYHNNSYYFEHWAIDFLTKEYSRQNALMISIGKDLNLLTKA